MAPASCAAAAAAHVVSAAHDLDGRLGMHRNFHRCGGRASVDVGHRDIVGARVAYCNGWGGKIAVPKVGLPTGGR